MWYNLSSCYDYTRIYTTVVAGDTGGRAAGEENARKFRQEQHVLRVVLQLLPIEAGLQKSGVSRPAGPSVFVPLRRQPVAGRGSILAQRVVAVSIKNGVLSYRMYCNKVWSDMKVTAAVAVVT